MNTYQEKCEAQYLELQETKEKLEKAIKLLKEIYYESDFYSNDIANFLYEIDKQIKY